VAASTETQKNKDAAQIIRARPGIKPNFETTFVSGLDLVEPLEEYSGQYNVAGGCDRGLDAAR
jgi:hypothetical protein